MFVTTICRGVNYAQNVTGNTEMSLTTVKHCRINLFKCIHIIKRFFLFAMTRCHAIRYLFGYTVWACYNVPSHRADQDARLKFFAYRVENLSVKSGNHKTLTADCIERKFALPKLESLSSNYITWLDVVP